MLELKDATLSVEGRTLLDRLSMMALDGQMTCITGREGCGKTLLLRVLMGFVPLDEGLVSVDGELVTPLSASVFRRQMAYVPQPQEVLPSDFEPETDDLETVWGFERGEGIPQEKKGERKVKATELPVVTFSGKRIVLADDPSLTMLAQLRTLANEGLTVVVASQREEFLNMSDRIITLGNNDNILS